MAGFKGGKGIATSAGVLAALMPPVLAVALSLWIVATLVTRTVSIGSLLAAVILPPAAAWFYPGQWIYFGLACLAGGLAVWRHRSNIQTIARRHGITHRIRIEEKEPLHEHHYFGTRRLGPGHRRSRRSA